MRYHWWLVALTFLVGLGVAVGLVRIGEDVALKPIDFGPELVKAGLQVGAATLIGAGVALVLRLAEESRADKRRRAEYRAEVFQKLVMAYDGVKAVRRTLRAEGFRATARDRALSTEDAAEFHARMRSLTESQLMFEGVVREIRARQVWFDEPDDLIKEVEKVEKYVRDAVEDWEKTDGSLVAGARLADVHRLEHLRDFLDDSDKGFKENAKEPMRKIEEMLREEDYPGQAKALGVSRSVPA